MDAQAFTPPVSYFFTLAPGEQASKDGEFTFLRALSATGEFNLALDLGTLFPFNVGLGCETLTGQIFRRFTIENPATAAGSITVRILAGRMKLHDDRLNILTVSDYLPVTEPATEIVGQNVTSLAAAANVILVGTPGAGQYQRAAVIVDNLSATLALTIYDDAGNVAGYVLPASSRYLPLSGYVKIANDNGAAVACGISELWQLNP